MLFEQLIAANRVVFAEKFDSWEAAVRAGAQTLLRDGAIEEAYVVAMIECIRKYGPYIIIAPDVAMPHAQGGGAGVRETALAFMKVTQPVHFSDNPEHDARLFFVLASTDSDSHLDLLQALVEEISDEQFLARLLSVDSLPALKSLVGVA